MSKTLKIGITGGIGTGKSTVCHIFSLFKIPIYDADSRAKYLIANDLELKIAIKNTFGKESFEEDGNINRIFLAQKVFNNPNELAKLNALVHPAVRKDALLWAEKLEGKTPYWLKEAALLFESGSYKELDKIIVVTAPLDLRIERVLKRDTHRSAADIEAIISKQLSEEEKIGRANFVIVNDNSQSLIEQVLKLDSIFRE